MWFRLLPQQSIHVLVLLADLDVHILHPVRDVVDQIVLAVDFLIQIQSQVLQARQIAPHFIQVLIQLMAEASAATIC